MPIADAVPDSIESAVLAFLLKIPERWEEFKRDELTEFETKALYLLVGAGMIERKFRFRFRAHTHPVAFEATVTATGEGGFCRAVESLMAAMWAEYRDAVQEWNTSEAAEAPFGFTESVGPDEWRLTSEGVVAKRDLGPVGLGRGVVLDFVLKKSFFATRPPVGGSGALVKMHKVNGAIPGTTDTNIKNWGEGADAFSAAFAAAFQSFSHAKMNEGCSPNHGPPIAGAYLIAAADLVECVDSGDSVFKNVTRRSDRIADALGSAGASPVQTKKGAAIKFWSTDVQAHAPRTMQKYLAKHPFPETEL